MTARKLEQYFTPERFVTVLFDTLSRTGYSFEGRRICEPCVGDGAISARFPAGCLPFTNDLDPTFPADGHADARLAETWQAFPAADWVVTNPPFSGALPILQHALAHATAGVALLVRISFLEPTFDRQDFLAENPPSRIVVLPRHSFSGDGATDSVTCGWLIWEKAVHGESAFSFLAKLPKRKKRKGRPMLLLGETPVKLRDTRFCQGCPREPRECPAAYTSRIVTERKPEPLGTHLSDWRRGDGCPIVQERDDAVAPAP